MSTIKLNPKVTEIVLSLRQSIRGLEKQIQEKSDAISNLITGICLNEGLELPKLKLSLNEDCTELQYSEIEEVKDKQPEEVNPPKKTKIKKLG